MLFEKTKLIKFKKENKKIMFKTETELGLAIDGTVLVVCSVATSTPFVHTKFSGLILSTGLGNVFLKYKLFRFSGLAL